MVCRPLFGDHMINGWMIEDVWEFEIKIEDGIFTKQGMESCLDVVLRQENDRECTSTKRGCNKRSQKPDQFLANHSTKNFHQEPKIQYPNTKPC
ncbi:hypothetical protein G4B88_023582 [Cannabis sativa]|uniref:Uncharacterized protein n=1 Tax=Cannabis sativa TaxID=3483 RepID=A0A7J6HWB1_CANSA|nr:hypothetical protein G4B88_023582 [Cannabis sativa]